MEREKRLSILEKVASGEMSLAEGSELLRTGELESAAAEETLEVDPKANTISAAKDNADEDIKKWKKWWVIPFGIFTFLTILAGTLIASSYIKDGLRAGFWISLIFFFICVFGMVVSILSKFARWIHIRVTQKPGEKPQVIRLSFPLPLRFAGWALNHFSWAMPEQVRDKQIGEALKDFEHTVSKDQPFHVLVDEENGEHVEVYIG